MRIIVSTVSVCVDYSKLTAVVLCLIWLFFVTRYLELKPEYATLDYMKKNHENNKNNGIVRMNAVSNIKQSSMISSSMKKEMQNLQAFGLFQLSQSKNKINCQQQINLLVINANYREIGDSYLTLYKQIEKQNPSCKNNIFQLCRREHLLFDSDLAIANYAMEVAITIQILVRQYKLSKLMILTFQQACAILLTTLLVLSQNTISSLGTLTFINAYNFNIKIKLEPPYRYIHDIQAKLMLNRRKMQTLNQTQLVFISTTNFYDKTMHAPEDQRKFNFLWPGNLKLQRTLTLNTRFMKNIFFLMHERDYFTYSNLPVRLAKFFHIAPYNFKKVNTLQYFFKYGQLSGKLDPQLKLMRQKLCLKSGLNLKTVSKFTKIKSGPCVVMELADKLRQPGLQNHTALIVTGRRSLVFNSKYEKIQSMFETAQHSYYMFDRMSKDGEITLININMSQPIYIEFHKPYAPLSNPLPLQILSALKSSIYKSNLPKQNPLQRKLLKTCPQHNTLIYPQHFLNSYSSGNSILTSVSTYTLSSLAADYNSINTSPEQDCYPDFMTNIHCIPQTILIDWYQHVNLIILLLLCSYVRKRGIYNHFFFYFVFLLALNFIVIGGLRWGLCFGVVCFCVFVEKVLWVVVHLVSFIQDMVDLKYRKLMLLLTVSLAITKCLVHHIQQVEKLSAWKLFLISLIFLVNRSNIIILVVKVYYMSDFILYNHNDCLQILIVLLWIYSSLQCNQQLVKVQQPTKFGPKPSNKKQTEVQNYQWAQAGFLETILISFFCIFLDGPTFGNNMILNLYMVIKSSARVWSKNRSEAVE